MSLEVGQKAPNFTAPIQTGDTISLSDFLGKTVILYFYPKDNTSGCTKQAEAFRDLHKDFLDQNVVILGVSKDSVKSHQKFIDKFDLPFDLISNEDTQICQDYGIWKEKSMYGRKYMGVERTTFVIDTEGNIQKIWPKVKVPGHVEEVLEFVKS